MRRIILASLAASLLVFAATADAAKSAKSSKSAKSAKAQPALIDVMTQNQYLGADLVPVVEAGAAITSDPATLVAFNAALLNALGSVAANLPEQRFDALAREILGRRPHVVGLQEVFGFTCTPPPPGDPNIPPGNGCLYGPIAGAFNDHLTGTLDALHGTYVAKATVRNLNITLPIVTPLGGAYVTVIDRDVILVRSDLAGAASVVPYGGFCSYPSVDGCNFDFVATTSIGGQPLRIERGFVGIDLSLGGSDYRIVDTHLEVRTPDGSNPYSRIVQSAQAYQLIQTTVNTTPPGRKLIVVGDINSDPRDPLLPVPDFLQPILGVPVIVPPYTQFAAPVSVGGAGFTDAWTMRPGANTGQGAPLIGYSCCQDEDLANRHSAHYERIDMVFSLIRPSKVFDARLLGTTVSSKTWPPGHGLWPSDHAAVAAAMQY
jgi:hypothetical protein